MPDRTTGNWGRRGFLKATGAAGAAAAVGVTNVSAGRQPGPKENELVANLSATETARTAQVEIQQSLPDSANVVHRNDSLNYLAVALPETASQQAFARVERQLKAHSGVESVDRNVTFELHAVNDPRLDQQYAPDQVRAPAAWERTLGQQNVEIAIIDSGVNYVHENLENQFGADPGRDFSEGADDPPASGERHGTHVAGIASATTDNRTGTAGMSNSRLYSVRSLGGGRGSLTDIADGIDWATQQGVDVINMSLGGGGRTDLMKNAVSNAYDAGILIFASAGNDGPTRDTVGFPAAYDECVAVSALAEGDDIARFSSRGPEVEITGPGAEVLSTLPGDDYGNLSGTSMSCPAVTGVAALGLEWAAEQGVDLSNSEMRGLIKDTARDVGLSSNLQGSGCANADALLSQIGNEDPPEDPPEDPGDVTAVIDASSTEAEVGEEVTLDGSGSSSENGAITEYAWETDSGESATGESITLTRDSPATVGVTLTVTDEAGETATDSVSVEFVDGGGGGTCGENSTGGSTDGTISWYNNSDAYTYSLSTTDPCQLTVDLSGPRDADFDLYVTFDGRTPSPSDYDAASTTTNAREQIVLDDPSGLSQIGILVDGYAGWGTYTLAVEELSF